MDKLAWDLTQLCRANRDGSATTQYQRSRSLRASALRLRELGFRQLRASSLRRKHVEALVRSWQAEGLAAGTIKNRLSHLRWWAAKIDRRGVVPPQNKALAVGPRVFVTNESKARALDARALNVRDPHIACSLRLQAAFGLRREESLKIRPDDADRGSHLELKGTWCKNGRPRSIPIRTDDQRAALEAARKLANGGSLIPKQLSYAQHLRRYTGELERAGLSRMHGLRHAYAQQRYLELTGRPAPAAGGPTADRLSPPELRQDQVARATISLELGHERPGITAVYLGR